MNLHLGCNLTDGYDYPNQLYGSMTCTTNQK